MPALPVARSQTDFKALFAAFAFSRYRILPAAKRALWAFAGVGACAAQYSPAQRRTCPAAASGSTASAAASGAPDGLHRVSAHTGTGQTLHRVSGCRVRLQHLRRRCSGSQTVKPAHWVRHCAAVWQRSGTADTRHDQPEPERPHDAGRTRCRTGRAQARGSTQSAHAGQLISQPEGGQRVSGQQQRFAIQPGGFPPAPSLLDSRRRFVE